MTVELSGDDILRDGAKVGRVAYRSDWKRWRWEIGDATGDEETRGMVVGAARIFLASGEAKQRPASARGGR